MKALRSGTTLVVDRYSYSGLTYGLASGVDDVLWPEVGKLGE